MELIMHGGNRPGAGRKPAPIDLVQLEKLCSMQCTDAEIAAWFKVTTRTLENRKKQSKFALVMERGRALGRISVRRHQMKLLEAGNPAITIFLGKIILGQRDSLQITGVDGGPIQTETKPDFSRLSEDELRGLRAALAKAIGEAAK
jgi:hypothetical protein